MAEITKPTYQEIRFNTKSAQAARTAMPRVPDKQYKPSHEMRMADIVAQGTVNIYDAYQAAKATAVRLEYSEEEALLQKHIGERRRH